VRDLTADSPTPLPVRHDQRTGFYVDGLTVRSLTAVPRLSLSSLCCAARCAWC
jgi:hypothetical protein